MNLTMSPDISIGLIVFCFGTLIAIISAAGAKNSGVFWGVEIFSAIAGVIAIALIRIYGDPLWVGVEIFVIFLILGIVAGVNETSGFFGWFIGITTIGALIAAAVFGLSNWVFRSTATETITFSGKVVNPSTGAWNNNRLIIVFKNNKEVARATSTQGEFEGNGQGIIDGLFVLEVPNEYRLTLKELANFSMRRASEDFWNPGMTIYSWIPEVQEGSNFIVYVVQKNITYTIQIMDGDISTLPPEIVNGTTELRGDQIVVAKPDSQETTSSQSDDDVLVNDIEYKIKTEEVPVNTILPINVLNNCDGTVEVGQKYTQTQTFIHKYTSEIGLTIGAEIPIGIWGKIMPSLQAQYGFEDGQVDTISIEYNTAAAPGTSVAYIVTLKELWESGVATVTTGNSEGKVPFRVKTNLIYEITSQPRTCP